MSLDETRRRRQAVSTVHDVVGAMRAIAAGRIQAAQRALDAAHRYHDVVIRGLASVLADAEPADIPAAHLGPITLLALTSEQPFCGSFNQDIADLAARRREELRRDRPVRLLVVGHRGLRQFLTRGLRPDDHEPAATSLEGVQDLVKRLAVLIGRRAASGELGALHLLYNRYQSVSEQVPTEQRVLPIDLAEIRRSVPAGSASFHHYLSPTKLLKGLMSEYAYILLYHFAVESYASEQASRLVAMDASTRNTERMLEALLQRERRERQGQVTREVLELISARFATGGSNAGSAPP